MKTSNRLRSTVLRSCAGALMALAPAALTLVAQPAAAQSRVAAPQITGMNLDADAGLQAGSDLRIRVQGTPRSVAVVNFGKTDIDVRLRESAPGIYTGTYTVRRADRIDPASVINVRLSRNNVTTRHAFTYPPSFLQLAMGAPAAASVPVVVALPAPRIERFLALPTGRIEPGRELRYRVHGLPGATVTLEIPGVVNNLAMREVSPGVYEAGYTIRQRDDLEDFQTAVATLRSGERWVTSRIERAYVIRERERDDRAPSISAIMPRQGDLVSPVGDTDISADFDDGDGRGVDPASVRVTVSGRDVTRFARITPDGFSYRADLPPGRHTAEVTMRDRAGNSASRSWAFEVGAQRIGGAPPMGPLPLRISSHANGTMIDASGNVLVQGQTAPFARVHVRVDAVPPVLGQLLGVSQTVFDDTVQADREGRFSVGLAPRGPVVPLTRYEVTLSAQRGDQQASTRITLHQRG